MGRKPLFRVVWGIRHPSYRHAYSAAPPSDDAGAPELRVEVAGIDKVGPQVVRHENNRLLTQMITDLEAQLAEPTPG
jgi:uncharacterized caspase-like protein